MHFLSPTITGVKVNQSSWNLAQRWLFYIFESSSLPEKIGLLWPKIFEVKNLFKYFWIAFSQRIFYLSTSNFNHYYTITIINDYIWLKFQVIIFIYSREKKIFLKLSAFSFSDDNRSKSQPIALKFGTEISFLYFRTEFVTRKNRFIMSKDIWG